MFEFVAKTVGSILRFFIEIVILDFVLFQLGRGVLLVVTLGRYPKWSDCERSRHGIQWVGVLTLVLVWVAIALYNNLHG
jgi:hypothetical protein